MNDNIQKLIKEIQNDPELAALISHLSTDAEGIVLAAKVAGIENITVEQINEAREEILKFVPKLDEDDGPRMTSLAIGEENNGTIRPPHRGPGPKPDDGPDKPKPPRAPAVTSLAIGEENNKGPK